MIDVLIFDSGGLNRGKPERSLRKSAAPSTVQLENFPSLLQPGGATAQLIRA